MKILKNEFICLFTKRTFFIIVAILFLLCYLLLYISSKTVVLQGKISVSSEDYKTVAQELNKAEDIREYLFHKVESEDNYLYRYFTSQIDSLDSYEQYLINIEKNTLAIQNSIFVESTNSFVYRNAEKTKEDYSHLKDINPVYVEHQGVLLATSDVIVDLIFIFLILAIVILVITLEKPMLPLYHSTKGGRKRLIISKIITSTTICFVLHTVMTVILYGMAFNNYPITDFSYPIQSIFMDTTLKVSIWQYLILVYLMRFIVYSLFLNIFIYLAVKTNHMLDVLGIFALIMGISAFLYTAIPAYSYLNVLKYINAFYILSPSKILHTYINLNIFGFPVRALYMGCIVILILSLLLMIRSVYIFEYGKTINKTIFKISIKVIHIKTVTLFFHEIWRLLIANKAVLIILFGILMQLFHINNSSVFIPEDELYYYRGVEEAKQQSNPIEWVNEKYTKLLSGGTSKEIQAMDRLLVQLNYLESASLEYGEFPIIYETPYKHLVYNTHDRNAVNTLIITILILLMIIPIREQKFNSLYRATKFGRSRLVTTKYLMLLLTSFITFVSIYLPEFIAICSKYNTADFNFPTKSLVFIQSPVNIPMYFYLLIIYTIKLITIICISFLAMYFSKKGIYIAFIIFSILFLIPALLNIFDIEIFKFYPTNWLLDLS